MDESRPAPAADSDAARVGTLYELMREYDLDALRVRIGEAEYELVRRDPLAGTSAAPLAAQAAPPSGPPSMEPAPKPAAAAPANVRRVTAPVVGVFYRSPSPGSDPFVNVGDRVSVGQTLCILEAMKLMNEITSDHAGVVTRIIPEDTGLVALGEELMWIEP